MKFPRPMPSGWVSIAGDQVKVVSASNEEGIWDLGQGQKKPMIGKVRVLAGSQARGGGFFSGLWALGQRGGADGH